MKRTRPAPSYSKTERDRRWALARALMGERDLDALVIFGEREGSGPAPFAFDTYFTNDRPGAIVVFPRGGEPVALVPLPMYVSDHFEAVRRGDEVWLEAQNIRVAQHPAAVATILRENGIDAGAVGLVGLEPSPPYHFLPPMPFALRAGLAEELPDAQFVPVQHELARRMMRLSDEEVEVVRYAATIGDAMAEAMHEVARPGVSESEVYAAGMHAAHRRGCAAPGMLLSSGPGSIAWGSPAWVYRPQAPRTLESGDVILAEVFTSYGMKETQHQVAIALGDVHEDFERAAGAARAAYDAGIAALRPGQTFGSVAEAMRAPIEAIDGGFVHPVVHGLNPFGSVSGVPLVLGNMPEARDYVSRAEIPNVFGELVLQPGMCFAFEPNCAIGRRVINLGGTVLVGEEGAEELNPLTADVLRVAA